MAVTPQRFRDVSRAAVSLAAGAAFVSIEREGEWVMFNLLIPADLNIDDPSCFVPAPAVLAWLRTLAAQVTEARKRRGEVAR